MALDLVRRFGRAGHQVQVAESVPLCLAGFSRYVAACHRLPPPRQQPQAFAAELARLVEREGIDLVIPTCEEVVWVARALGERVFAPSFVELVNLHNKWTFQQTALKLGLRVPPSWYVESVEQALDLWEPSLVLKPAFCRFGTETRIAPTRDQLESLPITPRRPWVAQRYLPGQLLCSYSLAQAGRLTAHVAYRPLVRLPGGAGVLVQSLRHAAIQEWVIQFVRSLSLTGQLAFDFIEDQEGRVWALECNPRATSGVHLFGPGPGLCQAFLDQGGLLEPDPNRLAMLLFPTLWADPRACLTLRARPVVCDADDPLPSLGQALSFAPMVWRSLTHGIGLLQATTCDIEWDELL